MAAIEEIATVKQLEKEAGEEEAEETEAENRLGEIGLISRRAEVFRVKMLKHFHLLDAFDEGGTMESGGAAADAPNLQTADIVDEALQKPMMISEPNALVQFQVYSDKFTKAVTVDDRRRNRVRNKNTANPPLDLWASWIVHSSWFKNFIVVVLIISAVVIGLQTDLNPDETPTVILTFLYVVDLLSLLIFCLEILLKWIDDFVNFWSKNWNVFDFIVTMFCFIIEVLRFASMAVETGGPTDLAYTTQNLRSFRILRSLKLISRFKAARDVTICAYSAVKSIIFITILMFIFAYIYAVIGVIYFKYDKDGTYDFPRAFTTIGEALKTLFQIFSNDHWIPIMKDLTDVTKSVVIPPIYVATWLVLSCYIFGNILIGIVVNSYQDAQEKLMEADLKEEQKMQREVRESAFVSTLDSAAAARKSVLSTDRFDRQSMAGEITVEHWSNMVEKNILELALEEASFCWPRDTLLRYYLLMEALQENLEERKQLLDLANHAVLQMFDV